METSWTRIRAAAKSGGKTARVWSRTLSPTGWGGGYKRKAPTGVHKCLKRSEMAALMARLK